VELDVPVTEQGDVVEDYHGEGVADPYRWLEETDAPATRAWIEAQNAVTERLLRSVSDREAIRRRLRELTDYPRFGVPFERGGRWFQLRNPGLAPQAALFTMEAPDAVGRVLLDPNLLAADGTVSVPAVSPSDDGSLLAFASSSAGSDWQTWRVRDVASGSDLVDVVPWSKFSAASWRPDGSGFYYGGLPAPDPGAEYLGQSRGAEVRFHRLGTPAEDDVTVFSAPDEPEWLPHGEVSHDGRYLVITISRGTRREHRILVLDLADEAASPAALIDDFGTRAEVVTNVGSTFYLRTDLDAERHRIVAVDLARPERSAWREVVAEERRTLISARHVGQYLLCHKLDDARSALVRYDLDGGNETEIELTEMSAIVGLEGRPEAPFCHLAVSSFTQSGAVLSVDLAQATTTVLVASTARIDPATLLTEQISTTSADGTEIKMFCTHRRDVAPTGEVPTLLYGYGGFDIPVVPAFSPMTALFVERGGLYVSANLRGGGEYGSSWHDAGRLERKQNVFDDFAACARWCVSSGWTRRERLGITGRSNGGLLVGAALTQHPELYGAAVPEVGVLDLLRFHRFTIGWAWVSDYGNPDDAADYAVLRRYSPLHNIQRGTHYPPTLVTTGDHDDRVVPGHSFKFAAALQAAQGGPAPIVIRVDTSAGHGMGKPTGKVIEERADVLTFLEWAFSWWDRS
jgi:prolyl oligopeptidase